MHQKERVLAGRRAGGHQDPLAFQAQLLEVAAEALALEEHLDEVLAPAIRQVAYQRLLQDPDAAAAILPTDGRRVVRALEVVELTGRPYAASAPSIGAAPRWDTLIVGLDWDTTTLDERLRRRTDTMFDAGLVEEVNTLIGAGLRDGVTAARALGYAQVLAALDAGLDGREALEPTFVGTRRYVRRQRSWFRRDHRVHWLDGAAGGLLDATVTAWRHVS